MPEKEEAYEIVPVDPFSKIQKKSESLEQDIKEIKAALKGTVGLSKMGTQAEEYITHILDLVSSSQQMVEEVARSNQEIAAKIQASIDSMKAANEELSGKLGEILDFFGETAEGEEEEGADLELLSKSITEAVNSLKESVNALVEQNNKTHELLSSIERHLKRKKVMGTRPSGRYPPPSKPAGGFPPPSLGAGAMPPPPSGGLPPPPFPPE